MGWDFALLAQSALGGKIPSGLFAVTATVVVLAWLFGDASMLPRFSVGPPCTWFIP